MTAVACAHPQTATPPQMLYLLRPATRSLALFVVTDTGAASPAATINEAAPDEPVDVSVDLMGDIFIANRNGNIRTYIGRNLNYQLGRTLSGPHTGIVHPTSIAVDIAGNILLGDAGSVPGQGYIEWFAAGISGNVMPDRVIRGPHTGLRCPTGVALDASGRLFVADHDANKVMVFAADAKGDATPIAVISGLHSPQRLFVDPLLDIFVTSEHRDDVAVFIAAGTEEWTAAGSISNAGMHDPVSVGTDTTGRIAIAAADGVRFFAPGAREPSEPVAAITGAAAVNASALFIR
jgi:DNA-binding beta-propeller fold protein YncE